MIGLRERGREPTLDDIEALSDLACASAANEHLRRRGRPHHVRMPRSDVVLVVLPVTVEAA